MNSKLNTKEVIMAALLCAIGIMIPMISPIKIVLEPASFTLASHVAIFIAMFISTKVALLVTVGTTIGFFIRRFSDSCSGKSIKSFSFCNSWNEFN